jgi:hypothetical protein
MGSKNQLTAVRGSRNSAVTHICTRASHLTMALALVGASACASMPRTGMPATGEPLSVHTGTVEQHHTVKEKVGEVEHKTSDGKVVGTSEVYADRDVTTYRDVWYGMQGSTKIDDEDFFRIAGDKEAADEVRSYRETGVTMNRIGLVAIIVGAAAMAGGYYFTTQATTIEADGTVTNNSIGNLALPFLIGGGVAVTTGGTLTWLGARRTGADVHPVDDVPRAVRDAQKYNRSKDISHSTAGSVPRL